MNDFEPIGILTDITKCIGCRKCVAACNRENKLPPHFPTRQENGDGLSADRWTAIIFSGNRYVRNHCRHCLEPACVSACPVGALHRTDAGAVVYDADKCMGCRYCMMACPFAIPRYTWSSPVPYIQKCTFCSPNRIRQNRQPACTEVCPTQATIFGEREALLAEARRRLREKPKLYLPKIYGEREVGGTRVLYISDVPLEFLGWQADLGARPLPSLTWSALKKVPAEFFGMGAVMTLIRWITGRRRKVAAAEIEGPKAPGDDDAD